MKNMIARTAEFVVKNGKLNVVKDAIDQFVRTVHVSEPGTPIYISLQDEENEFKFLHFMVFESEGAEQKHHGAVYTQKFVEILYPNCKKEPVHKKFKYVGGL
ncbi:MAG: antibiotic biosynthesis monooxygenase [Cyclobacteriaceae bacterium]|nr:antibiotic biosynthesis monooxygenase [Cyclobacteriaceae bacterium]